MESRDTLEVPDLATKPLVTLQSNSEKNFEDTRDESRDPLEVATYQSHLREFRGRGLLIKPGDTFDAKNNKTSPES